MFRILATKPSVKSKTNDNKKKISVTFNFTEKNMNRIKPKSPLNKLNEEIKFGLNFKKSGEIDAAQNLYRPSKKEFLL